jgi:hypothetical protein
LTLAAILALAVLSLLTSLWYIVPIVLSARALRSLSSTREEPVH